MNKSKYLVIIVLVLLAAVLTTSVAYFAPKIINNNVNDVNVSSGKLELTIDDKEVNTNSISPIYDEDYEMLSYNKDFEIISNSSLNSCSKLYLDIKEISPELKSKYFKYKLVGDGVEVEGNFENAEVGEMLILDNLFIEANSSKYLDLYIWLSYQEDVDQLDMLGTKIDASLLLKSYDARNNNSCMN